MKMKRFTTGAGRYSLILFLPRLSIYLELDTLYLFIEIEFLLWYAYAGVRLRKN